MITFDEFLNEHVERHPSKEAAETHLAAMKEKHPNKIHKMVLSSKTGNYNTIHMDHPAVGTVEHKDEAAAHAHAAKIKKDHPELKTRVLQGRKSLKWKTTTSH